MCAAELVPGLLSCGKTGLGVSQQFRVNAVKDAAAPFKA